MDVITQIMNYNHPVFYLMIAWSFIWKGIALWHAARHHQKAWFIIILLVNTIGVLEIIYLLFFRKYKSVN